MFVFKDASAMLCEIIDRPNQKNIIAIFPSICKVLYAKHNIRSGEVFFIYEDITFQKFEDEKVVSVKNNKMRYDLYQTFRTRPIHFAITKENDADVYIYIPNVLRYACEINIIEFASDYAYGEYELSKRFGDNFELKETPSFYFEVIFNNFNSQPMQPFNFEVSILWLKGILRSLNQSGKISDERYLDIRSKMYAATKKTINMLKSKYETALMIENSFNFTADDKLLIEIDIEKKG